VKLDQAHGHHRQIGHHVVFAEKRAHRAQQFGGLRRGRYENRGKGALGLLAPMPGVLEGFDLRVGGLARRAFEQMG
jgi:hypothetical protein